MKKYIPAVSYLQEPCEIYAMATIGTFDKPSAKIKIEPDSKRQGDCYFKCYNAKNINNADAVARIDFRSPRYFIHTGDGRIPWYLNARAKRAMVNFLESVHRDYKYAQITNWDITKYFWNLEFGFLDEPYPEEYSASAEAYVDGFYDTEENLSHPSYLSSELDMPNYLALPERK